MIEKESLYIEKDCCDRLWSPWKNFCESSTGKNCTDLYEIEGVFVRRSH